MLDYVELAGNLDTDSNLFSQAESDRFNDAAAPFLTRHNTDIDRLRALSIQVDFSTI